ncbi:hypothetical protein SUGI_0220650 [Cryptomeria japonica]|nr:hypothetical protein SUGI_0220650 [Cryptomeria japonica]
MDTEFPRIVVKEIEHFQSRKEYKYRIIVASVNLLSLITTGQGSPAYGNSISGNLIQGMTSMPLTPLSFSNKTTLISTKITKWVLMPEDLQGYLFHVAFFAMRMFTGLLFMVFMILGIWSSFLLRVHCLPMETSFLSL